MQNLFSQQATVDLKNVCIKDDISQADRKARLPGASLGFFFLKHKKKVNCMVYTPNKSCSLFVNKNKQKTMYNYMNMFVK